MKKITLLFAFFGMMMLQSCTIEDTTNDVDNDTISEVFEVTTSFSVANNYTRLVTFNPAIYASDMVLVYHLYDVVNGADVWRLMPQTYYLGGGDEVDYNFDFTRYDVSIFMDANFDLNTLSSAWTQNQTFRIVVVPGYFSGKTSMKYEDYNATIKALGIKEIKKLN